MRSDHARIRPGQAVNGYLASLFSLDGKVAVVTGASGGIGGSLVGALTRAGAHTVGLGRSKRPSMDFPDGAEYRQGDILDHDGFTSLCAGVIRTTGRLDILINAAGITLPDNEGPEAFSRTLATNLEAAHHCCRVAASHMKRTGGGSIVNVTSIGSVLGFPHNPAYAASKGGLRLLTKALAMDYGPDGIRVNNLAPGYIRTAMTEASFLDPVRHAERLQRMIIKRWGMPEDLAGAAVFLASDASAYITGIDLFVDGGWTAKGL